MLLNHRVNATTTRCASFVSSRKPSIEIDRFGTRWIGEGRCLRVPAVEDFFKDKPFDFEPGQRWRYSNSGYVLLGAIIEKVSGQSYADFMRAHIFEPLGMKQTVYDETMRIIPGRASGYARDDKGWRNAAYLSMSHPFSAGSLLTTVDDLARWDAAIGNNELLTSIRRARRCPSMYPPGSSFSSGPRER